MKKFVRLHYHRPGEDAPASLRSTLLSVHLSRLAAFKSVSPRKRRAKSIAVQTPASARILRILRAVGEKD